MIYPTATTVSPPLQLCTLAAVRIIVVLHCYSLGFAPLVIALLWCTFELASAAAVPVHRGRAGREALFEKRTVALLCAGGLGLLAFTAQQPASWLFLLGLVLVGAGSRNANLEVTHATTSAGWTALGSLTGGVMLQLAGAEIALWALLLVTVIEGLLAPRSGRSCKDETCDRVTQLPGGSPGALLSGSRATFTTSVLMLAGRDVVLLIALPLHLVTAFNWSASAVGGVICAGYAIEYCVYLLARSGPYKHQKDITDRPAATAVTRLAPSLLVATLLCLALSDSPGTAPFPGVEQLAGLPKAETLLLGGLAIICMLFAVARASLPSAVSPLEMVGGEAARSRARLATLALVRLGTVLLSGWLYQHNGLGACFIASALLYALGGAVASFTFGASRKTSKRAVD